MAMMNRGWGNTTMVGGSSTTATVEKRRSKTAKRIVGLSILAAAYVYIQLDVGNAPYDGRRQLRNKHRVELREKRRNKMRAKALRKLAEEESSVMIDENVETVVEDVVERALDLEDQLEGELQQGNQEEVEEIVEGEMDRALEEGLGQQQQQHGSRRLKSLKRLGSPEEEEAEQPEEGLGGELEDVGRQLEEGMKEIERELEGAQVLDGASQEEEEGGELSSSHHEEERRLRQLEQLDGELQIMGDAPQEEVVQQIEGQIDQQQGPGLEAEGQLDGQQQSNLEGGGQPDEQQPNLQADGQPGDQQQGLQVGGQLDPQQVEGPFDQPQQQQQPNLQAEGQLDQQQPSLQAEGQPDQQQPSIQVEGQPDQQQPSVQVEGQFDQLQQYGLQAEVDHQQQPNLQAEGQSEQQQDQQQQPGLQAEGQLDQQQQQPSLQAEGQVPAAESGGGAQQLNIPNVLLIGAQRGGTTSIANWMYSSGVCQPKMPSDGELAAELRKGVTFFNLRWKRGELYQEWFKHCNDVGLIMDATPSYLKVPHLVREYYNSVGEQYLSQLKLIVVLREPIEAELSQYNYKRSSFDGKEGMWYSDIGDGQGSIMNFEEYAMTAFKDVLLNKPQLTQAYYVDHLKKWTELFKREQLLVLSHEELREDPATVKWRIEQFMGYELDGEISSPATDAPPEVPEGVRQELESILAPKNEELYQLLSDAPGPYCEQRPFPRFRRTGIGGVNHEQLEKLSEEEKSTFLSFLRKMRL